MGTDYKDLIAWQKSMDVVEAVYRVTQGFPREEMFGLTSQLRRSAVSIPSNIAEGHGRWTPSELIRGLRIANGSRQEAETQVIAAVRLNFLNGEEAERLLARLDEVGRIIFGLARAMESNA